MANEVTIVKTLEHISLYYLAILFAMSENMANAKILLDIAALKRDVIYRRSLI